MGTEAKRIVEAKRIGRTAQRIAEANLISEAGWATRDAPRRIAEAAAEAKRLEAIAKAEATAKANRKGPGYVAGPLGFGFKYYNNGNGNSKLRFATNKQKYSELRPAWNKARRLSATDGASDCSAHRLELNQA